MMIGNYIDRAIEVLAPQWAVKRARARLTMEVSRRFTNSGYSHSGASTAKKSMRGWISDSRSPQEDIGNNLAKLRERSRDLYMSGGLATSAINKNKSNVLGSGLALKSQLNHRALGLTPEQAKEWEAKTEAEFQLWALSKIDNTGLNDFYDAQRIALQGWLMNGDSLAVIKYADRGEILNPYRLRLHLVEADRLSTPGEVSQVAIGFDTLSMDYVELPDGRRIQNGVETDPMGRVIAYHICNRYPNSMLPARTPISWQRVDAYNSVTGLPNVVFIMDPERAEQYRGVPYLTPVIEQLKQMTRYTEAEITAAIINSFFTAFITTEDVKNDIPLGESIEEDEQLDLTPEERLKSYEMGPGTLNVLGPGEDVKFGEPKHPVTGFDAFMKSMAQLVGASLDLPYEMLLGVFNSSYSASRAALLQAWRPFRDRRDWFAHDFCQPIYETWLFEAVATGRIQAPGFFADPMRRKLWSEALWIGPSPGQIDPVKEVQAAAMRIANKFSTHEKETMELTGMDYDNNVEVLRREYEAAKDLPSGSSKPANVSGEGGENRNGQED